MVSMSTIIPLKKLQINRQIVQIVKAVTSPSYLFILFQRLVCVS